MSEMWEQIVNIWRNVPPQYNMSHSMIFFLHPLSDSSILAVLNHILYVFSLNQIYKEWKHYLYIYPQTGYSL